MKHIALLAVLFPLTTFANSVDTVFLPNSALPSELRARILQAVEARCSAGLTHNTLREEATRVREESVDQGVRDYFYTTDLHTTYLFDGTHPVGATITVVSAEYSISNPSVDHFEIKEIKDWNSGICR